MSRRRIAADSKKSAAAPKKLDVQEAMETAKKVVEAMPEAHQKKKGKHGSY